MFNQPTVPNISNDGKSAKLLQQLVWASMPQNRIALLYVPIEPVDDAVSLMENLTSCQLLGISGEDESTGQPVNGSDLWAKIDDVQGGQFMERNVIVGAVTSQALTQIAGQLIVGIIESADLVINLKPDHGLSKLWFVVIPPQYFANPL